MPEAPVAEPSAVPATVTGTSSPEVLKSFDDLTSRLFPPDAPAAPDPGQAPPAPPPAAAAPTPVAEPAKEAKKEPAPPSEPLDPFSPPPSVLEKKTEQTSQAPEDDLMAEVSEAPEGMSEGGKISWKHTREKVGKLQEKVRELSEKAGKVDPDTQARIGDLEKRNLDLMSRLEGYDAEQVPWYQDNIKHPLETVKERADALLSMAELDPSTLRKAMSLNGKARIEALDELYEGIESPTLKSKLERAIAEIDVLEEKRESWINDRKSNSEQRTLQERIERSKAIEGEQQRISGLTDSIIDYLRDTQGFEMLKKSSRPEDKAWNERIDADVKQIKHLALENTNQQVLLAAITLGVQAPHYKKWAESLQKQLTAERQKNAELEGTVPGLEGRNGAETPQSGASGDYVGDTEDFASGAMRLLRRRKSL